MTGFTVRTRALILERDHHRCQWCGRAVFEGGYSLQHRRARGMGGSKRADTNGPANGVTMCGSATTGCHGFVESHRLEGLERGFIVAQGHDPAERLLRDYLGRSWWLLPDGTRHECTEPRF